MSREGDLLDRLSAISIRGILLHPVFLFIIATSILIGVAISSWQRYRTSIVPVDEYRLTHDSIHLSSPPPVWVGDADVQKMVLDQFQNGHPNTLDTNLVPATAGMLESLGWVEQVHRIEKSKDSLDVDLTYRFPVALVKIGGQRPWLPVDGNGVIFDGTMLKNAMSQTSVVDQFLLVYVFQPELDNLHTWQMWPDQRIQGAAAISRLLNADWQQLGIKQIVSLQQPGELAQPEEYQLRPKNGDKGTVVIWGSAPGNEVSGEAPAPVKLAAIQTWVADNGTLEQSNGEGMVVDVRSGTPVMGVRLRTAAEQKLLRSFR